MTAENSPDTVREAVAVFQSTDALQDAIDDLLSSGFNRAELSLLAGEKAVEEKLHHAYQKVQELEDNPDTPKVAYVSTESVGDAEGALVGALVYVGAVVAAGAVVATGGTMAAALGAAVIAGGGGGLIGSAFAKMIGESHADYLQGELDRGGLLLWVRTWDAEHEARAVQILKKHSGQDVHVHTLPA